MLFSNHDSPKIVNFKTRVLCIAKLKSELSDIVIKSLSTNDIQIQL